MSLSEIASQLGTSKTNLKRALAIERNLTEDMKDCLDKGVFSKTVAADIISSLSEEEQEKLKKDYLPAVPSKFFVLFKCSFNTIFIY